MIVFLFIILFLTCGTSKRYLEKNAPVDPLTRITKKAVIRVSISNEDKLEGVDPERLRKFIRDHLVENVFPGTERTGQEILVDVACYVQYNTRLGIASSFFGCIGIGGILMGATYPAVSFTKNFPPFGAGLVLLASLIPDEHQIAIAQIDLAIYDHEGKQIKKYSGYADKTKHGIPLTELIDFKHSAPRAFLENTIKKALIEIESAVKKDQASIEGVDER